MKNESFSADGGLIHALLERSQTVACGEGRTLFNQGESPKGLFILERGEAALVMSSNSGRAVMCLEVGSGSLLGLPGVITRRPYTLTAFIRKGSAVRFIAQEDFERTVREQPELYPGILHILAAEVHFVRQVIRDN
jgi:CRP-like cAMP-binding protein